MDRNEDFSLRVEIALCVLFAFTILLFVSNFGLGGAAGRWLSGLFKGLFGIMAYPLPIVLFFGTAFAIANRNRKHIIREMIGVSLTFLSLCAIFQLLLNGFQASDRLVDYYRAYENGEIAGGFFGGLLAIIFGRPFGIVGAYILTMALLFIGIILISQKPLLSIAGQRSGEVLRDAKEKSRERRAAAMKRSAKEEGDIFDLPFEEDPVKEEKPALHIIDYTSSSSEESDTTKEERPEEDKKVRQKTGAKKITSLLLGKEEAPPEELPAEADITDEAATTDVPKKRMTKKDREEIREEASLIKPVVSYEKEYLFPKTDLLTKMETKAGDSEEYMRKTAEKLQQTLADFGVQVRVTNVSKGPSVTRYELEPEHGVKVSRIVGLSNDIKLGLAASDIRIEAPIPGKSAVGIEVPNKENSAVPLRDMIETPEFKNFTSKLAFTVGRDIGGKPIIADIKKMPHLLIAGATGSGKSVCINTLIMSILYKATPKEVRMIMIDPKVIELSVYNGIPHLLLPVVTDPKKAAGALAWAVTEMERRYKVFAEAGTGIRDLASFNMHVRRKKAEEDPTSEEPFTLEEMPQILIIVDELADLMMVASQEVEQSVCRLTQLARAAGIHLVIATQRPSVDVITGLIKANMPSRIAFAVSSGIDSRTILDMNGAEQLLGKGDMLFYPQGYSKPARVQGTFVSDEDVAGVVEFLKSHNGDEGYDESLKEEIEKTPVGGKSGGHGSDEQDEYFEDAGRFIIEKDKASIGMLQRYFKIGFNRAARIMDQLCDAGVVGEEKGTKPREILMTMDQFESYIDGI